MSDTSIYDDLDVVGSTIPIDPESLPMRLSPIYRSREGVYYLPIDESDPAEPRLSEEDASWIDQHYAEEQFARFPRPLPARPGYTLLQVYRGRDPEYLPAERLKERLEELCLDALHRAAAAVRFQKHAEATEDAWYAVRAGVGDPLPLLSLIALLRGSALENHIRFLEKDLEAYTPSRITRALAQADRALDPLLTLIRADPVSRPPRPDPPHRTARAYLDALPDESSFFKAVRRYMAAARTQVAA
jgi:hypothetical protein